MPRFYVLIGLITPWLAFAAYPSGAYDLRTHAAITGQAFENSQRVVSYLQALGIRPDDTFTVEPPTPSRLLADFVNTGKPYEWMIEGSIREDDFTRHSLFNCPQPQNPFSAIDRPRNHFFDAQRGGRGLTVFGQTVGLPAPDWALGRQGRGPNLGQNQFSLLDARDYQLQSLTAPTLEARDRNTARLFRALGQVVHTLQDMAQPQHTRSDPHAGCVELILGEQSWYEDYIEKRARRERFGTRGEGAPGLVLNWDRDRPVQLPSYQDFFTGPQGMADFSSRKFFSAGTNFSLLVNPCGGLPEPVCEPAAYGQEGLFWTVPTLSGVILSGTITFYTRDIADPVAGRTYPAVRLSSRSIWDQHLENHLPGSVEDFSLNTFNYDAMADILVPRAVGYSAGFLDYFFRGRLEAYFEDSFDPFETLLTIINRSDEAMTGTFELYYETSDKTRHHLTGWNLSLAAGEKSPPLRVPFVSLPPDEILVPYLVVFKGSMGAEPLDAVAASWVEGLVALVLTFNVYQPGEHAYSFRFRSTPELADVQLLHDVSPDGVELLQVVCRNLTAVPQPTLVNRRVNGLPSQSLALGALYAGGVPGASIVEFEPPASVPDMLAWRIHSNPPRVRRVIRPLTELDFDHPEPPFVANTSVDLTGVRCFGVRVDSGFALTIVTGFLISE